MLTLLTRNVAHAKFKCGWNIENNTRSAKYSLSFYLHHFTFRLQVLLSMDTQTVIKELSSQRRNEKSLKIGDGSETRETEFNVLQRLRNKGARKRRERSLGRHGAQTASEIQATSQWKSNRERGADEERKFSDTAL